jgi:putative hydrolase of the HAD superfamily
MSAIRAITLDLDDTLWPFAPIEKRIECALEAWMREHSPATATMFPLHAMRELRARVLAANGSLHHDLGALRRLTLETALRESHGALHRLDEAYDVFVNERNRVDFFPDVLPALPRLAAHMPLAALSNGMADLQRIGIHQHFSARLYAHDHGAGKPEPGFFHAACAALNLPPHQVLHVGDHREQDVIGAMRAGMRACWINRDGAPWPAGNPRPDLEFATLGDLADWVQGLGNGG